MSVITGATTVTPFEDDNSGLGTLGNSNDAEGSTTCTISTTASDFIDLVLGWVDFTREPIASLAFNLDTELWALIPEGSCRFQIDGVPAELQEGLPTVIGVCTTDIRRPVTPWVGVSSPYTGSISVSTWRVDIVARRAKVSKGKQGVK